jgi:hypothetical protein
MFLFKEGAMLDGLIKFGACFDWISPLLAIAQNMANGPSETLMIPQACGWSGGEIARLLRRHGVHTWGHMAVNDTLMMSVRQSQARWARYLLQRAGLPGGEGVGSQPSGRGHGSGAPAQVKRERADHGLCDALKEIGDLRIL